MQDDGSAGSDLEVHLGGLPICRSLSRKKSSSRQAPAPPPANPFSGPPHHGSPAATAAAAAASKFLQHGQRSRRQSRLTTPSPLSSAQVRANCHAPLFKPPPPLGFLTLPLSLPVFPPLKSGTTTSRCVSQCYHLSTGQSRHAFRADPQL